VKKAIRLAQQEIKNAKNYKPPQVTLAFSTHCVSNSLTAKIEAAKLSASWRAPPAL
jgi:hypothetical protein